MSSEWKRMKIGDLCDQFGAELQTGPFGSQLHSYDYTETGIPVVPTEAIGNGKINPDVLPRISNGKASELLRHTLRQGDILFARRGAQATGQTAIARKCDEGAICGRGAIRLRVEPAKSIVLPTFLATYLSGKETITWIRHHAIGATMPNLNEGIIRSISILLPSLQEQKAIAHILGTLDDKIELNRKTNETLEAMAKALFKSWFVDFDPVRAKAEGRPTGLPAVISDLFPDSFEDSELGEIPSGWECSPLADRAIYLSRGHLEKSGRHLIVWGFHLEYVDNFAGQRWGREASGTSSNGSQSSRIRSLFSSDSPIQFHGNYSAHFLIKVTPRSERAMQGANG